MSDLGRAICVFAAVLFGLTALYPSARDPEPGRFLLLVFFSALFAAAASFKRSAR